MQTIQDYLYEEIDKLRRKIIELETCIDTLNLKLSDRDELISLLKLKLNLARSNDIDPVRHSQPV